MMQGKKYLATEKANEMQKYQYQWSITKLSMEKLQQARETHVWVYDSRIMFKSGNKLKSSMTK